MSQQISTTDSREEIWTINKRFRVGESCVHNLKIWSNVSGKNTEPGTATDWQAIGISDNLLSIADGANLENVKVTDVSGDNWIIISGTYVGPDASKKESYSPNSLTRRVL